MENESIEEDLDFKKNIVKVLEMQQEMHKSNLILNISNIILSIFIFIFLIMIVVLK